MNVREDNTISYIRKITQIEARNHSPPSNNGNILTNYFYHIYLAFRNLLHNLT